MNPDAGSARAPEMVERVARALCRLQCERNRRQEPIDEAAMQRAIGYSWPDWVTEARAAIEAMGEPTEAMVEAALPKAWIGNPEANAGSIERWWASHRKACADKWRLMIGAACR